MADRDGSETRTLFRSCRARMEPRRVRHHRSFYAVATVLGVMPHDFVDRRLIGGWSLRALWRRRVL